MTDKIESNKKAAQIIYILYGLGFLTGGLTMIAGLIMAYIKRPEARGDWTESHFTWQIRTFWYGFVGSIIAVITLVIFIGIIIGFAVSIWMIVRIIKGWLALDGNGPIGLETPPAPPVV